MKCLATVLLLINISCSSIYADPSQSTNLLNEDELSRSSSSSSSKSSRSSSSSRHIRQSFDDDHYDAEPHPQSLQHYYGSWQTPQSDIDEPVGRDNRKPSFKLCKTYAPHVPEELPAGAFVQRVEAEDEDNDEIVYSFVTASAERPKFRIDSKTGVILTQHTFDRDEPIREKEVYITVRATDNGNPPLDDVCTFKVTIDDINDNSPVFDKVRYDESISEDRKVGQVLFRMTASDLDDGDNSYVEFEILPEKDFEYFRMEKETGIVYLQRAIDRQPGNYYTFVARANNSRSAQPQDAQIDVKVRVVESNRRAPQFIKPPDETISLKENFNDYQKKLFSLSAVSNIPEKPEVIFELLNGRTEQTNAKKTFVGDQQRNDFNIMLGKALDYETTTDYTLTVIARNADDLTAEYTLKITVEDVNDNIPYFTQVDTGIVLENEPIGSQVMQVRAFDSDGTAANNIVSFELADNKEFFEIDPQTGNITTLIVFDREEREIYNVKVIAKDNSPSALYNTGKPNQGQQVYAITIGDKNDHPPKFRQDEYVADSVNEDANIRTTVIEVKAIDIDVASQITYSIVQGNIDGAFTIDKTGTILVNNTLDYEKITNYTLRVRAFDGQYDDFATVTIKIANINDNNPIFSGEPYNNTIPEEEIYPDCIVTIDAYDPDIKDRMAPQHIKYSIVKKEQQKLLEIDNFGCLRMLQGLDRDAPNGVKNWQIIVDAIDEDGNGLRNATEVTITLKDINDNAPFLTNRMPIVWMENREPGKIVELTANDYDEAPNGPPFQFQLDPNGDENIISMFSIQDKALHANSRFDREERKEYFVPILISDAGFPPMRNVSYLHIIIGDENDNPMQEGESSILVYNLMGQAPNTEIGRIFVNDLDDWDLPDKSFSWRDGIHSEYFILHPDTGMITMQSGTMDGTYVLNFTVREQSRYIQLHSVDATVTITVKEIPEEAVLKSGSVRFTDITAEDFVAPGFSGLSPKDKLTNALAELFNVSTFNVDVFTVLTHDDRVIDVRFSVHGSPYYEPEKLNGMVGQRQAQMENELNLKMLMVNIDECLIERTKCGPEESCSNVLYYVSIPHQVYTNRTSFVGVNAYDKAECVCKEARPKICLNGGTPFNDRCECPDGFEGPNCELIAIGFYGNGYAMYPPISACNKTTITVEVQPSRANGLILYTGPLSYNPLLPVQDFLALELIDYYPVLTVDYGTGSINIKHNHIRLTPSRSYSIEVTLHPMSIEMTVDNCKLSTCMSLGKPPGINEFLNVNAPLQIGGSAANLQRLGTLFNWTNVPQNVGYTGCIRNLTVNGVTYNLGQPALARNDDPGCHRSMVQASTFGVDRNFLIAILCCIALLIILLLAVVVHRRRNDGWMDGKDIDDIRETIINYEDEGGGERDTEFDLNVLRAPPIYEDKEYMYDHRQNNAGEVPDIGAFLSDKKEACDKDQDAYPNDDVRYYAYEGDGNSTGSLSSLASCTDEGDLSFNYLSNFGPRFRKLADMYGEEPSDEESNVDVDDGWRI